MRLKTTDVWYNLGGVQAAYQSVVAPGPFAARQNVSHDARRAGVYAATPGTAPAWSGATGWGFTAASSHYLTTGIIPAAGWTVLVRYSGAVANTYLLGGGQFQRYAIIPLTASGYSGFNYFNNTDTYITGGTAAGTIGMTGAIPYRNGVAIGSALTYVGTSIRAIYIGALNTGSVTGPFTGAVQSVLFVGRTLSPAEMWQASLQMSYCHVNPEWSAWGRRRQYYYAPIEEAPPVTADDIRAAAAGVGAFGPRLGSAARMGHQQAAELPAAARAGHRSRLNGWGMNAAFMPVQDWALLPGCGSPPEFCE